MKFIELRTKQQRFPMILRLTLARSCVLQTYESRLSLLTCVLFEMVTQKATLAIKERKVYWFSTHLHEFNKIFFYTKWIMTFWYCSASLAYRHSHTWFSLCDDNDEWWWSHSLFAGFIFCSLIFVVFSLTTHIAKHFFL